MTGLTSGVASESSNDYHTCVIMNSGGAKCWGNNKCAVLGDNNGILSLGPVDVSILTTGVARIGVGTSHTNVLTTSGGVNCWGYNGASQLGNNTTTDSYLSVDVVGLTSGVASIAIGPALSWEEAGAANRVASANKFGVAQHRQSLRARFFILKDNDLPGLYA